MGGSCQKLFKFCLLAAAAGFFLMAGGASAGGCARGRMPQGTSIGGVDVSGLRPGEACAAVSEALRQELEGYALTVRAGGRAYVFRPPEIGWKADIAGAAARALREGGAQPLEKERALVREDAVLARICADAYRTGSPARALFDADAEEPFTFVRERAGRYIDGAALQSAVRAALAQGGREVRVRAVRVAPGCTLAEARASAALLSSFTTYYAESNAGRAHNVALAASRLNGRTIAPGEVLSFNACAGARTKRNGYRAAPVILEGEYVTGVGGGVCQVSTTLYNAALLAGLTVAEYHPHSLAVGYVPPSRDAMVSGSSCDLKVKNATARPVRIVARAAEGALTVRVYGQRSPVTYSIESEVLERIPPPAPQVGADAAPPRAAKEGVRSVAYLVRREPGRPDVRTRLRRDSYAPVRGVLPPPPHPPPPSSRPPPLPRPSPPSPRPRRMIPPFAPRPPHDLVRYRLFSCPAPPLAAGRGTSARAPEPGARARLNAGKGGKGAEKAARRAAKGGKGLTGGKKSGTIVRKVCRRSAQREERSLG